MPGKLKTHTVTSSRIPTLPAVAMEAIRLMEGEESTFDSIADLIKNDQVLTSRILHFANSSFIGSRKKVGTINQAISTLGFNAVRSIILSACIFETFSDPLARHRKDLVNFWLHSIGVAATAEKLAERLGFSSPDEAYVAGLLHDVGKLACYLEDPDGFQSVCERLDSQSDFTATAPQPLDIEKEILGTSHIDAGRTLATEWNLPEQLVNVIWLHHQPVFEPIKPDASGLAKLVRFADVLCVTHNVGSSYFLTSRPYCHPHFHFVLESMAMHHQMKPADVDTIMEDVHETVKSVSETLGIWDAEAYQKLIGSANVSLGSLSLSLEMEKRQLEETNRVLTAIGEMTRQLKPGMQPDDAARTVVESACRAFSISRCLCLVRNEQEQAFNGSFFDGSSFREIEIPLDFNDLAGFANKGKVSDLEEEAYQRLGKTAVNLSQGGTVEAGVINLVAGSRFLATFFVANETLPCGGDPILGELVADFSAYEGMNGQQLALLTEHFETFSLAAGNGIERQLVTAALSRQTHEMAEASRKMEESQRQLFHSHRLATVGRLAAGAAHEINNPLTIISLNIQIIERLLPDSQETKDLRERLRVVADQEERISKIIQDLMGFARPAQPKFCQASVAQITGKVLSVIKDRVSMKKIEVKNEISTDLPEVMVDPLQIEQVVMNLLINANHAMPDGGTIKLAASSQDGFVEINISDTGIGIPKKNLAKIFDPFFTTKKEGEGTGLGLAICHSIVEHNGGTMHVRSEEGKGATFSILLPIDKSSKLRAMKDKIEEERKKTQPLQPEKFRVLVIDDERDINLTLQETLRHRGYEADGAFDGVEGIGMLRFNKYHLVLLDIRMPRKDGLEVLHFIRDEFPDIKVIMITGLASKEEVKETVNQGAFACIKKPFRLEKVMETVEQAIGAPPVTRGKKA